MLFFCFFHVILDMDQYKSWSYNESGFYKYLDVNVYKKPTNRVRRDTLMLKRFLFLNEYVNSMTKVFLWIKIVSQAVKL